MFRLVAVCLEWLPESIQFLYQSEVTMASLVVLATDVDIFDISRDDGKVKRRVLPHGSN